MRNRFIIPATLAGVVLLSMAVVAVARAGRPTTLEFTLRDAVSKGWVWDATLTLQGRTIRSYYQTDRGVQTLSFTRLHRGDDTLRISAPGYEAKAVPVVLKPHANRIASPIDLSGIEIADLQYFIVFQSFEGNDIVAELRPVNSDGTAIVNHPCLDLWIGARVSVQMVSGEAATEATDKGASRGEELFRGRIEWSWDASPETVFRYSARIPGRSINHNGAAYRVIDYLILVPKPGAKRIDEVAADALAGWDGVKLADLEQTLRRYQDLFDFYVHTSWNVAVP